MNAAEPSLVAQIERIWNLAPRVQITFGTVDSDTGCYHGNKYPYTRDEAASVLRSVRRKGAYIEKREGGFYVEFPTGWRRVAA
jgi:hypothetical protein